MSPDEQFMMIALQEAVKGKGAVEPNPMVGAVIVENGSIVARGHHEFFGGPHAECNVIKNLNRTPDSSAVLYVTLEPCSTTGKTGPCTEAIIDAGIKNVVIGTIDPNPAHKGNAVGILRSAGIDVKTGVISEKCAALNVEFNKLMESAENDQEG